jgi:hypothetical protein
MNIAWIAGFFDGEGCVYLPKGTSGIQVSITQKDRTCLDLIANFYKFGTVSCKGSGCHVWRVCSRNDCMIFLRSIRQYSIQKRKDIEVGLLYLKTIDTENHGCHKLNSQIKSRRTELRDFLKCGKRYEKLKYIK